MGSLLLKVDSINKHFGPDPVLESASFEVRQGERIGMVGPNGAGKSTLLKIVAGVESADRGNIELLNGARLGYLEQHPVFVEGRTLWQEAQSGLDHWIQLGRRAEETAHALAATANDADDSEHDRLAKLYDQLQEQLHLHNAYAVDHHVERVLEGLGFRAEQYEQTVTTLSGGQQNRLLLAKLLLSDPGCHAARRTVEPLGHRSDRMARKFSARHAARDHRRQPRPIFSRPRDGADAGTLSRHDRFVPRQF